MRKASLPDAPSAVPAQQRARFQAFVEATSPLIYDGAAINASMARELPNHLAPGVTPSRRRFLWSAGRFKKNRMSFQINLFIHR